MKEKRIVMGRKEISEAVAGWLAMNYPEEYRWSNQVNAIPCITPSEDCRASYHEIHILLCFPEGIDQVDAIDSPETTHTR
jgi:hypothetical protein